MKTSFHTSKQNHKFKHFSLMESKDRLEVFKEKYPNIIIEKKGTYYDVLGDDIHLLLNEREVYEFIKCFDQPLSFQSFSKLLSFISSRISSVQRTELIEQLMDDVEMTWHVRAVSTLAEKEKIEDFLSELFKN